MTLSDERKTSEKKDHKFKKGNTLGKGRVHGSKSQGQVILERIGQENAESIYNMLVEKALNGNEGCAQFIIHKIIPNANGKYVNLPLPSIKDLEGVAEAQNLLIQKVGDGEITVEHAEKMSTLVDNRRKTIETCEIRALVMDTQKRLKDAGL